MGRYRRARRIVRALLVAATLLSSLFPNPSRSRSATGAGERCSTWQRSLTKNETLVVDGRARTYLVHAPVHSGRLPLVFAFHGRGETPEELAGYSGLSALAAYVVYPRGYPGRNGKLSWSGTPGGAPGVDDVRFVVRTLDRLERTSCVDSSRIYATGKSDGGGLAARLACVAADRFAAVASVAGAYYPIAGGCRPARAVAILEFHGTADRVVPYDGSPQRRLPNVSRWLADWARRDGCTNAHAPQAIATGVERRSWTNCARGATVEGYRIRDGGHTWPGATGRSGPGATSHELDATGTIASFFAAHVRRQSGARAKL